ncbi:Carbon storage regulator [Hydrogenovibrio crunogenus]|uniref:Translational regulator CsrA n=1 Tax=Hydrogenovibrio crunogenus TaxID=39765 RepID=A0A4P7P0F6_9GAMM|nr:carbon storage regulator CsrA [Hydrogenovibrio crunogenus]QBZ83620.1 Carbon storage regulator [Hydrogenovibrio crunogenus]
MLVLTRRAGETLMIGDDIKLTVVGIKSGQVRLGIEAPKDVQIQREELLLKSEKAENKADEPSGIEIVSAD